jgi:hypothetical protein
VRLVLVVADDDPHAVAAIRRLVADARKADNAVCFVDQNGDDVEFAITDAWVER